MTYVISLSGWRLHGDRNFIYTELERRIDPMLNWDGALFFRVGDAKGADEICRQWLRANFPNRFQVYTADWDQFGLSAGPTRNRDMLQGSLDVHGLSDLLIGFPQPGVYRYKDSGTWGCIKEAFRLGVEVCVPRYRLEESGTINPT